MQLEFGTKAEHLGTLQRAYDGELGYVWSGQLRNPYLFENLHWAQEEGILNLEFVEDYEGQESGYNITWLKNPHEIQNCADGALTDGNDQLHDAAGRKD